MLGRRGSWQTLVLAALAFAFVWLHSAGAQAYPWLLRHQYVSCGTCHYDPSGSGALSPYGRSTGDLIVQAEPSPDESRVPKFLFGAVPMPDWLQPGGDLRLMLMRSKAEKTPLSERTVWMQLDGELTLDFGNVVATGTLGYAPEGALGAALTRDTEHNVVSRQHWLGVRGPASSFFRAGRMNLPFGIRTIEHTLWARKLTRTNINDEQQYGAAAYFEAPLVRGELMGIAGNFQLRPDDYRERGYSAYLEVAPLDGLALGASSLITHRKRDTLALKETWRHVHGGFFRWVTPHDALMLLGEFDYLLESSRDEFHRKGPVGYLQLDFEPVQGSHFLATLEANKLGLHQRYWSRGAWLSYAWFFAPHADLRLDGIYQSLGSAGGRTRVTTLLLQAHVNL